MKLNGTTLLECAEGDSDFWATERSFLQWDEVGASFQDGYGIQGVTRETRACGLQGLPAVGEIDLIAAHYQAFWLALVETFDGTLMDTFYRIICLYFDNAALWRLQVASYYAISDEDAKKIFSRLPLDGPILPDEEWEPVRKSDLLPCLLELRYAFRSGRKLMGEKNSAYRTILALAKVQGARFPVLSASAIFLAGSENQALGKIADVSAKHGSHTLGYVFDGLYVFASTESALRQVFRSTADEVYDATGFRVALKTISGNTIERFVPSTKPKREAGDTHSPSTGTAGRKRTKLGMPSVSPVRMQICDAAIALAPWDDEGVALLDRLHCAGGNCVPWSIQALFPRAGGLDRYTDHPGPHPYKEVLSAVQDTVAPERVIMDASWGGYLPAGRYLVHSVNAGGGGHCFPGVVEEASTGRPGVAFKYLPGALGGPPAVEPVDISSLAAYRLVRLVHTSAAASSLRGAPFGFEDEHAGGGDEDEESEEDMEDGPESDEAGEGNASEESEEESDAFDQGLQACLAAECEKYKADLAKHGCSLECKLCPFREFGRKKALVSHVEKYHKSPRFTAEASAKIHKRTNQYQVARALYRQRLLLECVPASQPAKFGFLEKSADVIRAWNAKVPTDEKVVLQKYNLIPYVQVWTEHGLQLWVKSLTATAVRCHNRKYYTPGFEALLVSLAMQHRGQMGRIVDALQSRWAEQAFRQDESAAVPVIFNPQLEKPMREIYHHILTDPDGVVQTTLKRLKDAATERGEWTAISHDVTFKAAFSIIGQEKMSQKQGEAHAVHTFQGVTGASPGFSLQASEGAAAFVAAVEHLFTPAMRAQVRFLYSDSPSEAFLAAFQFAVGVAEDFLHLVLRCEYCLGGNRNACTVAILQLQSKFRRPLSVGGAEAAGLIYRGEPDGGEPIEWEDVAPSTAREGWILEAYLEKPFASRREYIAELKRISLAYPNMMGRTDGKGKTMLQHLKAGCSHRHFMYLQNGSVFAAMAAGVEPRPGTTANEAEHRSLKRWGNCVYQQHRDRLEALSSLYGLNRMLGNAYKNVESSDAVQMREHRSVYLMAGLAAAGRFYRTPVAEVTPVPATSRKELCQPQQKLTPAMIATRKGQAVARKAAAALDKEIASKHPKRRAVDDGSNKVIGADGDKVEGGQKRSRRKSTSVRAAIEESIQESQG